MIENIDITPSIEDIAINFKLSKEHIIRIFKKQMGITPHAYILNHKVNQAKNMLINNKKNSILNISLEAGFYDQSHFIKSFKKVYAITPSQIINNKNE